MNPQDLAAALAGEQPPAVLDVRLADDFEAARIPGSINNAVFEVAFHERLPEQLPDKAAPIVVAGATAASHEAEMASEKLQRAGYQSVALLDGGIDGWQAASQPLDTGTPLPGPPTAPDGSAELDLTESRVEWTGRNLLNKHWGTVGLKDGHLVFAAGMLVGGEITLDMRQLECTDLAGNEVHDILIRHLHDHDFFDVEVHPEARLVITSADPIDGAADGAANLRVTADLTLKGQTRPITFDASAGLTPEGKAAAQASFAIDRTKWGVLYGSGKFFHRLSGHLVNDLIEFQVRMVTT